LSEAASEVNLIYFPHFSFANISDKAYNIGFDQLEIFFPEAISTGFITLDFVLITVSLMVYSFLSKLYFRK
jgi:hypothetical protein